MDRNSSISAAQAQDLAHGWFLDFQAVSHDRIDELLQTLIEPMRFLSPTSNGTCLDFCLRLQSAHKMILRLSGTLEIEPPVSHADAIEMFFDATLRHNFQCSMSLSV